MPSTVIHDFHYHAGERRLEVRFQTGRRYSYFEVPPEIFAGMRDAFSKGEFFNAHIRDKFRFAREGEKVTMREG